MLLEDQERFRICCRRLPFLSVPPHHGQRTWLVKSVPGPGAGQGEMGRAGWRKCPNLGFPTGRTTSDLCPCVFLCMADVAAP